MSQDFCFRTSVEMIKMKGKEFAQQFLDAGDKKYKHFTASNGWAHTAHNSATDLHVLEGATHVFGSKKKCSAGYQWFHDCSATCAHTIQAQSDCAGTESCLALESRAGVGVGGWGKGSLGDVRCGGRGLCFTTEMAFLMNKLVNLFSAFFRPFVRVFCLGTMWLGGGWKTRAVGAAWPCVPEQPPPCSSWLRLRRGLRAALTGSLRRPAYSVPSFSILEIINPHYFSLLSVSEYFVLHYVLAKELTRTSLVKEALDHR